MNWSFDFEQLLRAALGDASESPGTTLGRQAVTELMKQIAQQSHSDGCILWRQRQSNPDQLSLMGGWFGTDKGNPITLSRVDREYQTLEGGPKLKTCAFHAIDKNSYHIENDLDRHFKGCRRRFFKANGIQKMLSAYVQLGAAAGGASEALCWKGVLCLYRTYSNPDYTKEEAETLQLTMPALARIYRGSVDAIKLALIQKTDAILQEAPSDGGEGQLKSVIKAYADAVANSFGAAECSVFLENKPGEYEYCFSTEENDADHVERTKASAYRLRHGFSGLALAIDECVRVRDLRHPEQDIEELKKKHGRDCFLVEPKKQDENAPTPPSLLVTRLEYRGKVVGFIRCWRPLSGSCFYLQEDAELLDLVARPLARYIARFIEEEAREQGIVLFDKLAAGKHRRPLKSSGLDVFMQGIEQAAELFPMAKIITVRLADPKREHLRIHGYGIHPSIELDAEVRAKADARKWALNDPIPRSYAAQVMKQAEGEGFWVKDASERQKYPLYTPLYPDVRQVMTVLIAADDPDEREAYGVLDLRTVNADEFTEYQFRAARALGLRIGNYYRAEELRKASIKARDAEQKAQLKAQFASLNARQTEFEAQRKTQQAFQDVSHQLKGPLHDLRRTLELMQAKAGRGVTDRDLAELLARARRSELFAKLVGLFSDLTQNKNSILTPEKTMTPTDWLQIVGPLVLDTGLRINPERRVRIELDADSFFRHAPANLNADRELMTHCVMNLLDNAAKYSHRNSAIRVFAGHSKTQRFYVAVTNVGIPIHSSEVQLCKQRGWRKPEAIRATGEGAGIGLYIVDKIMNLHQAELDVLATRSADGVTEIRLNFPIDST